jgi:hypothetical protein
LVLFVEFLSKILRRILVPALAGDVAQLMKQYEPSRTADRRIQEPFTTDDSSLSLDVGERIPGA